MSGFGMRRAEHLSGLEVGMGKDDKGGEAGKEKEKKAAIKGLEDMRDSVGELRGLHDRLGKHLDDYDKTADALSKAIEKENQAAMKQRWDEMSKLQTKIFEITKEVTTNKAKAANKAFNAMDAYIRG